MHTRMWQAVAGTGVARDHPEPTYSPTGTGTRLVWLTQVPSP